MNVVLNEHEVRVLGCLIEKELSTPEYYPLTLNALTAACSQKSNRDPVMGMEETEVVRALDALKFKGLALQSAEGGRVPKYRHILAEKLRLNPAELSVLAELLLRGPQTIGELRSRTERMHTFTDLTSVERLLEELSERSLVTKLPRQPGRKENRYAHLFARPPAIPTEERSFPPEVARLQVMAENERIAKLEKEVASLRAEVAELHRLMEDFKKQFE